MKSLSIKRLLGLFLITAIMSQFLVWPINHANASSWYIRNITMGGAGQSLAADASGNMHFSYVNLANHLEYTTNASGDWVKTVIDDGASIGVTSIGLDAGGKIYISYYDMTNKDLKFATNVTDSWVIESVETSGDVGSRNVIKVGDDGKARIGYISATDASLKFATRNGAGDWEISVVDDTLDASSGFGMDLDGSNKAHFSYLNLDNDITCTNVILTYITNTTGSWVAESTGIAGAGCSFAGFSDIEIDGSQKAHIGAYKTDRTLSYLTNATGLWVETVVDNRPSAGKYVSLVLDGSGKVHMSYNRSDPYVTFNEYATNLSGTWAIENLEQYVKGGINNEIVLDNLGRVNVGYYDNSLKVLRLVNNIADESTPRLLGVSALEADGWYNADDYLNVRLIFTKAVYSTGSVIIRLNTGASCSINIGSHVANCYYNVGYGHNVAKLNVATVAGVLKDSASRSLASLVPEVNLASVKNIGIDTQAPIINITSPADGYYTTNPSVWVTGTLADNLSGVKSFKVAGKTKPIQASFRMLYEFGDLSYFYAEAEDNAGNSAYNYHSITRLNGAGNCNIIDLRKRGVKRALITVKVKVWKYVSQKKKRRSTKLLTVHKYCGPSIKRIFKRIYMSKDRPVIDTGHTGCYRSTSNYYYSLHKIGAACDINFMQNAQFRWSSSRQKYVPSVGRYWHPGYNPADKILPGWGRGRDVRSISTRGSIPKAFWAENWGGQLIGDYMHFSLTGN